MTIENLYLMLHFIVTGDELARVCGEEKLFLHCERATQTAQSLCWHIETMFCQ